ncbi:MAG: glycosyltransferase [Burkholderiaceae bacterium]
MNVLFVHQNFPGQFTHLAPALARRGDHVRALGITPKHLADVHETAYRPSHGNTQGVHRFAMEFETKMLRADAAATSMVEMRAGGFQPDLVVANPGWGEATFVKDVWPETRLLNYVEFHYRAAGADVGFDPEFEDDPLSVRMRTRAKNASNLVALDAMDIALCPTEWQASMLPPQYRDRVRVIFDGIDTDVVRPDPHAMVVVGSGTARERTLKAGDEIVTFVNRNLEPYRGYHKFMRALPAILSARPAAVALIVGGADTSYGRPPPLGTSWQRYFLDEVRDSLDLSRVYFLGKLPYAGYLKVLQLSACHVYLTYPFVLSWSCMESLSCACVVVASGTAPVREVIEDGYNGLLVDFHSPAEIADRVVRVLANPAEFTRMRTLARASIVKRYDLARICLPAQLRLVDELAGRA